MNVFHPCYTTDLMEDTCLCCLCKTKRPQKSVVMGRKESPTPLWICLLLSWHWNSSLQISCHIIMALYLASWEHGRGKLHFIQKWFRGRLGDLSRSSRCWARGRHGRKWRVSKLLSSGPKQSALVLPVSLCPAYHLEEPQEEDGWGFWEADGYSLLAYGSTPHYWAGLNQSNAVQLLSCLIQS